MAPQLRIWTWGPTMLCLSASVLAALPTYWNRRNSYTDLLLLITGTLLVLWISIRAATSPVLEHAQADGLLTAMAVATFVSFRAIISQALAQRVLIFGLTLVLLASVVVFAYQIQDPTYSPIFPISEPRRPAGFFAHYSYGASFLIPVSFVLSAFALRSNAHIAVRILLGIIAILGCVAVYYTKSRGGFIGLGIGLVVLVVLSVLAGRQIGKKAFPIVLLALPFVLIILVAGLKIGLSNVQETRSGSDDLTMMLDNNVRFYLLGIALSCIAMHPFLGGGSRSFSWECFQFWDTDAMGRAWAKPEHVHNEFIQTASDYGILGAVLLLIFILMVFIIGIFRITADHSSEYERKITFWKIGGIAGFIGLFAQSNFEGILRLPTGAILLGFCLSAACVPSPHNLPKTPSAFISSSLITLSGLVAAIALAIFGWKGSLTSRKLWPSHFGKSPVGREAKADALTEAMTIWPLGSFYHQRAMIYQTLSLEHRDNPSSKDLMELAISDHQKAGELNPYSPEAAINSAFLLNILGRNEEAEIEFQRAVILQGNMEEAFHSNKLYANYLHKQGLRHLAENDMDSALPSLRDAVKHIDMMAEIQGNWLVQPKERKLLVEIRLSYGRALERVGKFSDALKEYDRTAKLSYGNSAHYWAGVLLGKRAVAVWKKSKSEDALALFKMALDRTQKSGSLPAGVTKKNKNDYISYLKKKIAYLEGARIEPSANPTL